MDLVGKTLADRYEILEEIGKGGMAHVYKAWCNLLNRFVAIKVLKEEFKDDKEFVRRFNVEAQAAAGISNPHIVSIYDVGYEDGMYYIVMEYVEGITLKEYIAEKGALPWREAAGYAAQICDGLEAAHKNNVVHRDIKPQNIIMAEGGILKVTDFGIARASGSQATMTMANTAIGTVHYLSPEQARGGYTDKRTDIYSLGVVLYEMLTGKLPFTDDSPVTVALKHIREVPIPPRSVKPDIPEAMEKVTLRAMNKEQNLRYSSAGEFLSDIEKVLKNSHCDISSGGRSVQEPQPMDVTESTIKMDGIDDGTLKKYDEAKRDTNDDGGYARYAERINREVEERKLRELDSKRSKREQKKKDRKVTLVAILAAVVVVAALGFAFSAMTGGLSFLNRSEMVEIPNLIDMDLEKAQHQYKDKGFSIIKDKEIQSDKTAGAILEQSPEAGVKKNKNSNLIIKVTVSAGNNAVVIESYSGQDKEAAQKALKTAGFQVNIREEFSNSVEKGKVIAQEPAGGSTVTPGTLVTLHVSKGAEDVKESAVPTSSTDNKATETDKPNTTSKPTTDPNPTSPSESSKPNSSPSKTEKPSATKVPSSSEATPGISD